MAFSGEKKVKLYIGSSSDIYLVFRWQMTKQSTEYNTSEVLWTLGIEGNNREGISLYATDRNYSVTIDGNTTTGSGTINYSSYNSAEIARGYSEIQHVGTADKTFDFSFKQEFWLDYHGQYLDVYTGSGTDTIENPLTYAPKCSITVSDTTNYKATYGDFVKGYSVFNIKAHATDHQSAIKSYEVLVNGVSYGTTGAESADFEAPVLNSGEVPIEVRATDSYGRTGSTIVNATVLHYAPPAINALKVKRCNSDGTENLYGAYVQITFSAVIAALNNKNSANYTLHWKKTSERGFSLSDNLSAYDGNYTPTNGTCIFAADTTDSYDVRLTAEDDFKSISKATSASTSFVLMHFREDGLGMGLGKQAADDVENLLDVGFRIRPDGGFLFPDLPQNTDLNFIKTQGFYNGYEASLYTNLPEKVTSGVFALEVIGAGVDGVYTIQRVTAYINNKLIKYERRFTYSSSGGSWTAWDCVTYPVGFLYVSNVATSPATLYGGTWTQISGQFLLGANSTYPAKSTGGAATHTLTTSEMPSHTHQMRVNADGNAYLPATNSPLSIQRNCSNNITGNGVFCDRNGSENSSSGIMTSVGGGAAHNNMPPYYAAYMWFRTA
jgi:hypothetical protein